MYILETEQSFDSAHFLSGYEGNAVTSTDTDGELWLELLWTN